MLFSNLKCTFCFDILLQIFHCILTASVKAKNFDSQSATLNDLIVEGIRDKKGKKIILMDMKHIEDAPADYFIVCEGDSNVHVKAISDSIYKKLMDDAQTKPFHIEGSIGARWVLMDYFSTLVHIFHPETRQFYELEHLWSDARITEYADL